VPLPSRIAAVARAAPSGRVGARGLHCSAVDPVVIDSGSARQAILVQRSAEAAAACRRRADRGDRAVAGAGRVIVSETEGWQPDVTVLGVGHGPWAPPLGRSQPRSWMYDTRSGHPRRPGRPIVFAEDGSGGRRRPRLMVAGLRDKPSRWSSWTSLAPWRRIARIRRGDGRLRQMLANAYGPTRAAATARRLNRRNDGDGQLREGDPAAGRVARMIRKTTVVLGSRGHTGVCASCSERGLACCSMRGSMLVSVVC
jgi:hypothetical protein